MSNMPFSKPGPASSIPNSNLPKLHPTPLFSRLLLSSPQHQISSPTLALSGSISSRRPSSNLSNSKDTWLGPDSAVLAKNMLSSAAHVYPYSSSELPPPDPLLSPSCSDVFNTPGPVYYISRPFDEPQPYSDSPQSGVKLPDFDANALEFQWIPFDRRAYSYEDVSSGPCASCLPSRAAHRDVSLPPIRSHGEMPHEWLSPGKTVLHENGSHCYVDSPYQGSVQTPSYVGGLSTLGSSDDLEHVESPLCLGINFFRMKPGEEFSSQMASTPCVRTPLEDSQPPPERPETACPFRFRVSPPPQPSREDRGRGREPSISATKKTETQDPPLRARPMADSEEALETEQLEGPGQLQAPSSSNSGPPVFAPCPGIYLSPIREVAKECKSQPRLREDIGKSKVRLRLHLACCPGRL